MNSSLSTTTSSRFGQFLKRRGIVIGSCNLTNLRLLQALNASQQIFSIFLKFSSIISSPVSKNADSSITFIVGFK